MKKKTIKKRRNILLEDEHYNMICTGFKNYRTLKKNDPMKKCIDEALNFFTESPIHLNLFDKVLSNPKGNRVRFCMDNHISEPQIYIYRIEIVFRTAMMAFAMGIFTL